MNKSLLTGFIKTEAQKHHFSDIGISAVKRLSEDEFYMESWLKKGMHATMHYLEKNKEKRYNPAKLVEGAVSMITVLYNYYPSQQLNDTDNYRISKYAYGNDYHFVMKEKLRAILDEIETKTGKRNARIFVDSAPVLDRAWARQSGLGFIGKNTMLIHKKKGSFFFIGHIILDLELDYDEPQPANYCGTCTLCIDACPTKALKPFELDARKCISYITIENRSDIPEYFDGKTDDWIFGCDICQDVCPWNRFATPHNDPLFNPNQALSEMTKKDWQNLDKSRFNAIFKNNAIQRAGFKGLKRNIDFARENTIFEPE